MAAVVKPVARADLPHRIEVGSAALPEIAEPQHAGAQVAKRARLRHSETTNLLGGLFFAPGLDLLPIMLAVPSPVGPMLHLVNPFCLHDIPPNFVRLGRASTNPFWRYSGLSRVYRGKTYLMVYAQPHNRSPREI